MQHLKMRNILNSGDLETADYPDDNDLKIEIDEISSRIDRITETVKEYFAVSNSQTEETEPEDDAAAQDEG